MFDFRSEPTISEIMREPMVRALMKADSVDATAFEARLRRMARQGRRDDAVEDGDAEGDVALPRFLPPAAQGAAERCCWG